VGGGGAIEMNGAVGCGVCWMVGSWDESSRARGCGWVWAWCGRGSGVRCWVGPALGCRGVKKRCVDRMGGVFDVGDCVRRWVRWGRGRWH